MRNKSALAHVSVNDKSLCPSCKGNHHLYQCNAFLKLPVEERINKVSALKLCFNCLRTTAHRANACEWGSCKKCGKRHCTLLHKVGSAGVQSDSVQVGEDTTPQNTQTQAATVVRQSQMSTRSDTLLSTAVVNIKDRHGDSHQCRAFLDPGSQSNFITERFVHKLGLDARPTNVPVLGFRQGRTQIDGRVEVEIQSRVNNYNSKIDCLIIDNLTTNIPLISLNRATIKVPSNIKLADPAFHASAEIDLLLGVDVFWKLLCVGRIRTSESQPLFQKTQLGRILAGDFTQSLGATNAKCCNLSITDNLDTLVSRFWELDQGSSRGELSLEERQCDELYMRTFRRNQEGRFIVSLPMRPGKLEQLGQSREVAVRRFHALERQLSREPQLKLEYASFMHEYVRLDHMRAIDQQDRELHPNYYLPHHAV